jgi:hypothetical protein
MYNMFEVAIGSFRIKGEYILAVFVFWLLFGHLICGCSRVSAYEGFELIRDNLGESAPYKLGDYSKVNTSSWFQQDLTTKSGSQSINNRKKQRVPIPEGQMGLLSNTDFKPECCPNTYSNGSGCACMTVQQNQYLLDRGGNNVPYSEY